MIKFNKLNNQVKKCTSYADIWMFSCMCEAPMQNLGILDNSKVTFMCALSKHKIIVDLCFCCFIQFLQSNAGMVA
jgi:hypothetical protein